MALTKIDDRGLKTPIDLLDNEKIRLGTGNDLEIYHNSGEDQIRGTGTKFEIRSPNLQLQNSSAEKYIVCTSDGAVDLYYDNVKRFETTSDGARFTGHLLANDDGRIKLGNSSDFQIYHHSSHDSYIVNDTGFLGIKSTEDIRLTSTSNELMVKAIVDGAVELYHNNVKTFSTESDGVAVIGPEGGNAFITFKADEGDDNADLFDVGVYDGGPFKIQNKKSGSWEDNVVITGDGSVELYNDNVLRFQTTSSGAHCWGDLDFMDNAKVRVGTNSDLQLYHDGDNSYLKAISGGTGNLYIFADGKTIYLRPKSGDDGIKVIPDGAVELYHDGSIRLSTNATGTYFNERQLATGGACKFRTYGGSVSMSASTNHDTLLTQDFGNDDMVRIEYAYNWNDGDGGAWGSAIAWNEHDSANMRTRFLGEEISGPGSSVEFVLSGNSLSFRFTTGGSGMNGAFMIIAYSKGCDLYTA